MRGECACDAGADDDDKCFGGESVTCAVFGESVGMAGLPE